MVGLRQQPREGTNGSPEEKWRRPSFGINDLHLMLISIPLCLSHLSLR